MMGTRELQLWLFRFIPFFFFSKTTYNELRYMSFTGTRTLGIEPSTVWLGVKQPSRPQDPFLNTSRHQNTGERKDDMQHEHNPSSLVMRCVFGASYRRPGPAIYLQADNL